MWEMGADYLMFLYHMNRLKQKVEFEKPDAQINYQSQSMFL